MGGDDFTVTADDGLRLASTTHLAVLVGGYDGSGNLGDVLQTRAAVERVRRAAPELPIAVVVEDIYPDRHRWARALPDDVISLIRHRQPVADALTGLPPNVALYVTGGGFINRFFGDDKLGIVRSLTALAERGGAVTCHLATGIQISPYEGLFAWSPILEQCDPLLVRDDPSIQAAAAGLMSAEARNFGDDAFGPLRALSVAREEDCVNVHLDVEGHVTERPDARIRWTAAAVDSLTRSRASKCRLLVAFDDDRVNERAILDQFVSVLHREYGAERNGAVMVSLTGLSTAGAPITLGAVGTVTSSYHTALLSLIHRIPTIMIAQNDYYRQKMSAIAQLFQLGDVAIASEDGDPDLTARLDDVRATLARAHDTTMRMIDMQIAAANAVVADAVTEFTGVNAPARAPEPATLAPGRRAQLRHLAGSSQARVRSLLGRNGSSAGESADAIATLRSQVAELTARLDAVSSAPGNRLEQLALDLERVTRYVADVDARLAANTAELPEVRNAMLSAHQTARRFHRELDELRAVLDS